MDYTVNKTLRREMTGKTPLAVFELKAGKHVTGCRALRRQDRDKK
jgi:hypothetical protein